MSAIRDYLSDIQNEFKTGIAGEHAYRPALKKLLESADTGLNAVNDPARTAIGMPDFVILRQSGNVTIGIVEAKDIGNQLSRAEKTQQLKRYMKYGNLILTNYLEFRWYVDGEKRETVRIAKVANDRIVRVQTNYRKLADMLRRFAQQSTKSVNSAQALAERLADSAQLIAHFISQDLKRDNPTANLANQMQAFEKTLLPDLDIPRFADMFAQTLVYGLFAARMNHAGDPAQFSLGGAAQEIPQTNPFLRRLFYQNSFDLGERLTWLVEGVVEILRHTDIDSILDQFGQRTGQTDPVVHFYETFLSAYNPSLRETRGVYYTPEPVVKYIVSSVDHILKTRFERPLGLADKDTLILDPAVGTGTFLYHVIEQIKERFEGQQGMWKDYVEERLLPRIFGFELLMAPYTVAHMNLGLQLKDAGYEFKENERLGIYLTNALEEGIEQGYDTPFGGFLVDEANAATAIKREKPIMVVLGNPPYSGHSANRSTQVVEMVAPQKPAGVGTATRAETGYSTSRTADSPGTQSPATVKRVVKTFIGDLIEDYRVLDGKKLAERNSQGLQDDYVKFIRFGQWRIEQTGSGIVAFITNHSFLTSPTFRGMRQNLLDKFSEIFIYDLHGNIRSRESAPDDVKDENVFDIQQGVSICILVKHQGFRGSDTLLHADLWGVRQNKYRILNQNDVATTQWSILNPSGPHYRFVPSDDSHGAHYTTLPIISNVFKVSSNGFKTHRDHFAIAFSTEEMERRVSELADATISDSILRSAYNLKDNPSWQLAAVRQSLQQRGHETTELHNCIYRPFDVRACLYGNLLMDRPRIATMKHMLSENLAIAIGRQGQAVGGDEWNIVTVSTYVADTNLFYRGGIQYFPVYLYSENDKDSDEDDSQLQNKQPRMMDAEETDYFDFDDKGRRPNLSKAFVSELEAKLGLPFQTEGSAFANGESPDWFGPEDVFYYVYAIFHSPTYRERYAEFLKIDFPRLPLTSDLCLFAALVKLGAELVSLHLMKSRKLAELITTFDQEGDDEVARGYPKYTQKGGRVHINKTQYFGEVTQDIWDFHIGGYQVLQKWLKDRRGRKLSLDEREHYQKIVVALSETIRIMSKIDAAIPQFPLD